MSAPAKPFVSDRQFLLEDRSVPGFDSGPSCERGGQWRSNCAMRLEPIDDLEDPRIAVYRNVRDTTLRDAHGLFLVESRLCVRRLLAAPRFATRSILVAPAALESLRDAFAGLDDATPVYVADSELLRRVVGYDLHRGCIAAAERGPGNSLAEILDARPRLLVGLERVANPENVGNVFRNAVAFGADAVLLSAGCADPLYRKAIRVSMAGTLQTPFTQLNEWLPAMEHLREAGITTVALSTDRRGRDLKEFDGRERRIALLLGTEDAGLDERTLEAADWIIRIPMAAGVDSLNVATASGVALHHCFSRAGAG